MAENISILDGIFCFFLLLLGVAFYANMVSKTKDKLNPFGVVCITWCTLAGIASLHLSWLESSWPFAMYVVVLLFPCLVFLCGNFSKNTKISSDKLYFISFSNGFIVLTRALFIICFICAILEWRNNGFALALGTEATDAKATFSTIRIIHYGSIYLPYCAINSLFELFYRKKKKMKTLFYLVFTIIFNIFYILFVCASRGSLLIIICAFVYLFLRKYGIPFYSIFLMVGVILIGFIAVSKVRIFSGSLVYDVIHNHPVISSVYGYTMLNFENLNKLITRGSSYSIIRYTYGGFLQLLGLNRLFSEPEYITTYFFNANTICYDFYEDLGMTGIVINTLLLFGIIKRWYGKSLMDRRYLLLIAVMQKAIWTTFFGNYFTIYRVMLFPFLVTGIVIYSMRVEINCSGKIVIRRGIWKGNNNAKQL